MIALSLSKFDDGLVNEDAVKVCRAFISISDGAGGGGVFADKWSKYLVDHLPDDAITTYETFDKWIDSIWEPFYNECESIAQLEGGMLLNKFYDEGSFATIVAIWNDGHWISYGDSVAFCYDKDSKRLLHSFGELSNFNDPPYLVNCKDSTDVKGFNCGQFGLSEGSIVFAASDTLAHYILMMYEVAHRELFHDELQKAIDAQTKNSNYIKMALGLRKIDFEKDVLGKLLNCNNSWNLTEHIKSLRRKGLIGHDDYSFVMKSSSYTH